MLTRRQTIKTSTALAAATLLPACGESEQTMSETGQYLPTIDSLRRHDTPLWFRNARFGVFIHWGLYSIPAYAPHRSAVPADIKPGSYDQFKHNAYAEWYMNSLLFEDGPTAAYHREHYGTRTYSDFAQPFNEMLEQWDPEAWARDIAASGARYLVLVTKHHDGFTLWPSSVKHPHRENWSTRRDVVGELGEAVRAQGMKFGVYYSGGIDWSFKHRRIESFAGLMLTVPRSGSGYLDYANAHYRELIERYRPDYLWNDICYPSESAALQVAADYYNSVDDGLINDRWIALRGLLRPSAWRRPAGIDGLLPPQPPVWDVRTPEYAMFDRVLPFDWETTRGIGHSFGYNREETGEDLLSAWDIVRMLGQAACCNGNVLLNTGPRGDGTLDPLQVERLHTVGQWLKHNGACVQDTQPLALSRSEINGVAVGATRNANTVYLHLLGTPPAGRYRIELPEVPGINAARLWNGETAGKVTLTDGELVLDIATWPDTPTQVLELSLA
ncbi:MAG: alpha-L-fucosidase [Halioglobus sp.]